MWEVSREPSTASRSGDLGGEPVLVGGPSCIADVLLGDCLGDGGVHSVSLSMESWLATAIRMN
jgi:hypothetical protein